MTGANEQQLQAGDLRVRLVGSDLRSVCWKGTEVLQRVYYAVRDAPWNTVPGTVLQTTVSLRPTEFEVTIRQAHRFEDIDVECQLSFVGRDAGELVVRASTLAHASFRYSKIGLNLHHGLRSYAGARYRARTLGGTVSGRLGDVIEPQLIQGDTLTAMFAHFDAIEFDLPGASVSLQFDGDRFEMQDHRNWCDANWKIYGTPLEYGFPMDCAVGQRFEQTVTVTIADRGEHERRPAGTPGAHATRSGAARHVELGTVADGALPAIGIDASAAPPDVSFVDVAPAFVRLTLGQTDAAAKERVPLGVPIELVVHVADGSAEGAQAQVAALVDAGATVERIVCLAGGGAFSAFRGAAPPDIVAAWTTVVAGSALADVAVFSGTGQSYNVIARDRPDYPRSVGIVFGAYPQIHAADDESIMENAAAFAEVVRDCRRCYPGRAVSMAPVHLISEDGPFPGGPPTSAADRPQDDPRYDTTFAAAWSVAVLAATSGERLDALTVFDAVGPRGVVGADGGIKPVGSVLAALGGRAGQPTRRATIAEPDEIAVLDVGEAASRLVLIANLRPERMLVTVDGWPEDREPSISWTDDAGPAAESSVPVAARRDRGLVVVPLEPYAVATVSSGGGDS